MPREKAQAVTAARPKVPMRRLGAHCLVVAMKRGNARGAKGVGHQRWIGSTGVGSTGSGRNLIINGRRQPSHGGTSRMMREYHVRIFEGLGVTTQNLTTTGSASFFDIFNNTGSTQTSLQITFTGTLFQGGACGGGGTGIQGSGPKPTSGNATCTVSITPTGASFQWNNINWGSGQSFDFQIASFSNGDTGTFCSVPGPVVGGGLPGLVQPADVIAWSLWRRAHQAAAQKSHLKQKSQL